MKQNQDGNSFLDFLDELGHYKDLSESEIESIVDWILGFWDSFLMDQEETLVLDQDYYIHKRNLYEVIKRMDKRKTYYYVFHKITKICEYKSIAIICYWINTLKPFMVVNEKSSIYNCPNEMFSLYLIVSVIASIYKNKYPDKEFKLLDKDTIRDYVYNFKYCDLSREATIFFVETLAKAYGVGMETIDVGDKYE